MLLFQVVQLRRHIEAVASKEPYMGEQMPIKWLKFEQAISKLVEEGAHYVSLEQVINTYSTLTEN